MNIWTVNHFRKEYKKFRLNYIFYLFKVTYFKICSLNINNFFFYFKTFINKCFKKLVLIIECNSYTFFFLLKNMFFIYLIYYISLKKVILYHLLKILFKDFKTHF